MTVLAPTYAECREALDRLSPALLALPHVRGLGIAGEDPAGLAVIVYVERGARQAVAEAGAVPAAMRLRRAAAAVDVPILLKEQDALQL